ncbi:hypothetical protein FC17_GL002712 [Secundilactobacillus paracollinoides DSM 15502 = JCM 11969]|nr:hypothetical protein FC17_GL002712 [Secundilactobacillus paracollinoides DSM 15502 = JCM 11969]
MEQFGTALWCRHQLATVLGSVTDVRDDEDPFESCAAEIELALSRATTVPCQIAECNGLSLNIILERVSATKTRKLLNLSYKPN